jgi:hypothetical protein
MDHGQRRPITYCAVWSTSWLRRIEFVPAAGRTRLNSAIAEGPRFSRRPSKNHRYWWAHAPIVEVIGVLLGYFDVSPGERMASSGDAFLTAILKLIALIIFGTVDDGVARMAGTAFVEEIAIKSVCFEV